MRRFSPIAAAIFALGSLTSCDDSPDAPGPGGVSEGEAAALDEAAEIIEARQLPVDALPQTNDNPAENSAPQPPEIPSAPEELGPEE